MAAANLRIGYRLSLSGARKCGLYISTPRGKTSIGIVESDIFSEPGLFLLRPDRTIYYLSVRSKPFVLQNVKELVQACDFAIEHDYPAGGEYTGALWP